MNPLFAMLNAMFSTFLHREEGQDTFEYVLIIGVLVVAILLAVATPVGSTLINAVIAGVCGAVNSLPSITVSC